MPKLTPLPRLAAKLRDLTGAPPPSYRMLYMAVVDGRLPSVQQNGRYFVQDSDLPAVAAALGLTIPPSRNAAELASAA